ncbi:MAG TPA: sugar phosphate nucleotidyltransferase [Anaerolineae bacterium]|nr:sugar phosphate nucleotidyltransferase [Anaerolineae bacterium]HPL27276.1 sugar phosphate nucleotidyltransferase [Anaerolineae bacterium]
MKVIIPLAGFGTRLRPHTFTKPKPLVNVAGKPVLGHILDKLAGLDIEEIIFVTGYLGDQIEAYVSANYSFPARYVEQKELKGQAHALYLTRDYVQGPVLIIFVDTIFETDLRHLEQSDADGILYVKQVEDPRRFGVAVLEDGRVTRLIEKPSGFEHNLAVIGVYYIRDSQWLMRAIEELIARDIKTQGEYFLADALQLMIDQGARMVANRLEVWEDCGKPETVLHTNRYLLDQGHGQVVPTENSIIIPPVYIARTARVVNSIVGPYVTIADEGVIKDSIVRDSIIDERAHIEDAMLAGSLIGRDAKVSGSFERLNVGDSSQVDFAGREAS